MKSKIYFGNVIMVTDNIYEVKCEIETYVIRFCSKFESIQEFFFRIPKKLAKLGYKQVERQENYDCVFSECMYVLSFS